MRQTAHERLRGLSRRVLTAFLLSFVPLVPLTLCLLTSCVRDEADWSAPGDLYRDSRRVPLAPYHLYQNEPERMRGRRDIRRHAGEHREHARERRDRHDRSGRRELHDGDNRPREQTRERSERRGHSHSGGKGRR